MEVAGRSDGNEEEMGGAQGLWVPVGTLALLKRQELRDSCEHALLLAAHALPEMQVPGSHTYGAPIGPGCSQEIWGSHSENSRSPRVSPALLGQGFTIQSFQRQDFVSKTLPFLACP